MRPYAKYIFNKMPENLTRYLLSEHYGADIPNFPAVYKIGINKGLPYIGFRLTQQKPKTGHRHFTHTFELAGNKTFTGVNFTELNPRKTFGDDKNIGLNDCVLIEFSECWDKVTMLFYKDVGNEAEQYFYKWLAGRLPVTVEEDCLSLNPVEKENADTQK